MSGQPPSLMTSGPDFRVACEQLDAYVLDPYHDLLGPELLLELVKLRGILDYCAERFGGC